MVFLGSDHAGFLLKEHIKNFLLEKSIDYKDVGTYTNTSCDYPDIAKSVSEKVLETSNNLGILICGTGIGMSITANKIKGIRAACCSDFFSAKFTRLHNDANILCIGARVVGTGKAEELVEIFIKTKFEGERHLKRLDKIKNLEK